MTIVEIRYKPTKIVSVGYARLKLNLGLEESIEYVIDLLTSSVQHIVLQEQGSEEVIKIENSDGEVSKSFLMDILELDKLF